ncbi:PTS system, ascorbate-specific IIA component [Gracilibacillus orientalis]|uniref:Ascorbate-specific PTS system EIIA component n=1 Tax=Gracilibacillus orientalis TaxID=334253 RepID=A0A1I4J0A7_9BACI|nr:PTS sugar transporter subunit IIA [Gracilibacillus orientalis]SFL60019.1 PTS system, ascorbate-specific IIA component [Gracilibacillus orientalis]
MTETYFTKDNVQFNVEVNDWKDAIYKSVALLRKNGFVTDDYATEVINNVKKYGPYIVIYPGIAIPHTRPENGALKVGVSLVTLKTPVYFKDTSSPVKIMISFSATDNEQHLEIIKMIVKIVENGLIDKISTMTSLADLNNLIGDGIS